MPYRGLDDRLTFLSHSPARAADWRVATAVFAFSALMFAIAVPFAKVQLPTIWAFIPVYQSALITTDLITAVLLYAQFSLLRSRTLLLLASAYLFTTLMAVVHGLTFPGLFAPTGLLGATPQSTAWLYMFWHAGFPLLIIGYGLVKESNDAGSAQGARVATIASITAVCAAVACCALIATAGNAALPPIMAGNQYTPALLTVVSTVWALSFAALLVLWIRRPHSVLDVWLMLVMVAWLFDIALSAVFNAGRFDLGFYAGRAYGLAAATLVLIVLLTETGRLYARVARSFREQRERDAVELSNIHARLSAVLESSPLPVFSLDSEGRIATWNGAAERVFGVATSKALGQSVAGLQRDNGAFAQANERVRRGDAVRDQQAQWQRADGRVLEIRFSAAPVKGQAGVVYVAEDITERVKLEHQLIQSQKMDAVGQLTGGVAHDFNNILTVITGTIDILHEGLVDRPQLAGIARMIDEAATRGSDLTRQLLAFARRQPLQPLQTDLNLLLADAAKFLRPTLGEQIEIETVLTSDAWPALIDPNQLTNAIINLAINARDAMPKGGRLTLETRNVVLDEAYVTNNPDAVAGDYAMIAVSDTGIGIPEAIRDKVFDPFFTTKETGKGTGLGLSMVFGFIKQSGGHIKIYSEIGHGTAVKMYLPRAAGAAEVTTSAAASGAQGGSETVLVVEDDQLVRNNAVMQLASLGYKTIEATNGAEALRIIETNGHVDLLFTDIVMPGSMNGRELADEVLRRKPATRVLFTSGYTENAIVHHGRLDPGVLLLGKPYRKAELARMVRVALD